MRTSRIVPTLVSAATGIPILNHALFLSPCHCFWKTRQNCWLGTLQFTFSEKNFIWVLGPTQLTFEVALIFFKNHMFCAHSPRLFSAFHSIMNTLNIWLYFLLDCKNRQEWINIFFNLYDLKIFIVLSLFPLLSSGCLIFSLASSSRSFVPQLYTVFQIFIQFCCLFSKLTWPHCHISLPVNLGFLPLLDIKN